MIVSYSEIEKFIKYWKGASKSELNARLKALKTKPNTSSKVAEIKAIECLKA